MESSRKTLTIDYFKFLSKGSESQVRLAYILQADLVLIHQSNAQNKFAVVRIIWLRKRPIQKPGSQAIQVHQEFPCLVPTSDLLYDVTRRSLKRTWEIMSPASRVANHGFMVWLWTGVSSGNRPMFGTIKWENTTRALEGSCVDRVPRGLPLWSGVGKSRDLGDRLAGKISARSDQGPEIRRICRPDHRDCCVSPFVDCFLMPSYYTPLPGFCLTYSISS